MNTENEAQSLAHQLNGAIDRYPFKGESCRAFEEFLDSKGRLHRIVHVNYAYGINGEVLQDAYIEQVDAFKDLCSLRIDRCDILMVRRRFEHYLNRDGHWIVRGRFGILRGEI